MNARTRNPLKGKMYEYSVSYQQLADYLHRSLSYVSMRVNGGKQWRADELRAIGKLLEIDDSEIMKYVS